MHIACVKAVSSVRTHLRNTWLAVALLGVQRSRPSSAPNRRGKRGVQATAEALESAVPLLAVTPARIGRWCRTRSRVPDASVTRCVGCLPEAMSPAVPERLDSGGTGDLGMAPDFIPTLTG
jgi:hypothetical protein